MAEGDSARGAVVIGVGNPFRGDDGVGPAVLEALRAGPGGIDETLPLAPGEHEVVVTATSDGPRTIPIVLSSAAISVPDPTEVGG